MNRFLASCRGIDPLSLPSPFVSASSTTNKGSPSKHTTPQEFNRGVFDYLIATDESMDTACGASGSKKRKRGDSDREEESGSEEGGEGQEDEKEGKAAATKKKAPENEDEKGALRVCTFVESRSCLCLCWHGI